MGRSQVSLNQLCILGASGEHCMKVQRWRWIFLVLDQGYANEGAAHKMLRSIWKADVMTNASWLAGS